MEHKIGEIVTLPDGRKAEVVDNDLEGNGCDMCIFSETIKKGEHSYSHCTATYQGKNGFAWDWECFHLNRTDGKNIIYKEIKGE